jgi:hypothetical protein
LLNAGTSAQRSLHLEKNEKIAFVNASLSKPEECSTEDLRLRHMEITNKNVVTQETIMHIICKKVELKQRLQFNQRSALLNKCT